MLINFLTSPVCNVFQDQMSRSRSRDRGGGDDNNGGERGGNERGGGDREEEHHQQPKNSDKTNLYITNLNHQVIIYKSLE